MQEITEALQKFIIDHMLDGQGQGLESTTPLLGLGVLDSLNMVSLLSFIESSWGLDVPTDLVRPEHFQDLESIASLVQRLQVEA